MHQQRSEDGEKRTHKDLVGVRETGLCLCREMAVSSITTCPQNLLKVSRNVTVPVVWENPIRHHISLANVLTGTARRFKFDHEIVTFANLYAYIVSC